MSLFALWLLVFGLSPFADPGHDISQPLAAFDVLLHLGGLVYLLLTWKVVRR